MKYLFLAVELVMLVIACVAFAMGFNEIHSAQMKFKSVMVNADYGLSEAARLTEQAHSMFTAAAVCGAIFLVLFLIRLVRHSEIAVARVPQVAASAA
ncbi:hypothetical protein [Corynebacterium sp.]|uniref:hypothetical protein n=1 Tax=Corynebacterium sp. TaxID=1720 RepID=UPI0028AADAAF|nr:hypothetical protein [Corynebacterium sp.]